MDDERDGGVRIGSVTNTGGNVVIAGRDANVALGASQTNEIEKVFAGLLEKAAALPEGPEKAIAHSAVQGLKTEAQKGELAEEPRVQKWFNYLADNAPEIFEVAVSTFLNPVQGLGAVFKKISEKALSERASGASNSGSGSPPGF